MLATLQMLGIEFTWDPRIANFGPFELTWHGIFTAIGIAVGVFLAAWIGRRQGITEDDAYSVALVGVPCAVLGERVHAFVCVRALNETTSAAALQAFCAARIADYAVPETWTIGTEPLPRNLNGKIVKRVLRQGLAPALT